MRQRDLAVPAAVNRSGAPSVLRLMMAHFAIRGPMPEAALGVEVNPDRLFFLYAVRVVRRKLDVYGAIRRSGEESVSRRLGGHLNTGQ